MKYEFIKPLIEEKDFSPAYVFQLDELEAHIKRVEKILDGKASLCYAMKANPFLVGAMSEFVPQFEVCSPGEFLICERVGIPMERIVLSGVYKNPEDIAYVFEKYRGKGIYTVESRTQWELLTEQAAKMGLNIQVLLRLTSGNQFGMDEAELLDIVKDYKSDELISIEGIQYFTGTQKSSLKKLRRELDYTNKVIGILRDEYSFEVKKLEYGTGFPVTYFEEEHFEEDEFLREFSTMLNEMEFKGQITLEVGRSIAASCGTYLTSVVDTKCNKSEYYAIVDGGMHQITYYGQSMAMKHPGITLLPKRERSLKNILIKSR